MNNKNYILWNVLLVGVVFLFSATYAFSGTKDSWNDSRFESKGWSSFERSKKNIGQLLEKKQELEDKFSILHREYVDLKKMADQNQVNIGVENKNIYEVEKITEQKSFTHFRKEELQSDDDVLESKNLMLRKNIYDKKNRIMGLKRKFFEKNVEAGNSEINQTLEEDLRNALDEEDALFKRLITLEKSASQGTSGIAVLKQENRKIKHIILDVERKLSLKKKEHALMLDKKEIGEKLFKRLYRLKESEVKALATIVSDIDKRYNKVDRRIVSVLGNRKKKTEIMQSVIKVDQENQKLRQDIKKLQVKPPPSK